MIQRAGAEKITLQLQILALPSLGNLASLLTRRTKVFFNSTISQ
jgi:hypothetical protein